MKNTLLCAIVICAGFAVPAEAIYKCTTAKGVIYQDRPCLEGTETGVQIVIPTGELAPNPFLLLDETPQVNSGRAETRWPAARQGRTGDDAVSVAKPADKRVAAEGTTNVADDSSKRGARPAGENRVPMSAEQARNADPTAKYYTTDSAATGAETPDHMTCESPTGEKRRFILTNGKLTSI
jgi:hypothetical protein